MTDGAYLGLDLGGTGAKAGVFDAFGRMLGFGKTAISPTVSSEGHVEAPIEQIAAAAIEAVTQAIHDSGAPIRAVAISSQGQTFVSLDEQDRPLHPAIIWYDSRASRQAQRMDGLVVNSRPRPVIEAIATAPKVMWLREHCAEVMSQARRYLLLPDYLSYILTGEAVTDPTIASSTALYADDAPGYSVEALAAAEIDIDEIARIQPAGSVIGKVRLRAAEEWGLTPDTIVVNGCNDQYAGALGAGNCRPGIVSETTGTCLALVTLTDREVSPAPGLWIGRFPIPQYRFGLAYAKTAGVILDWFQRELAPGRTLPQLDKLADAQPIGANGVTVLPHFDGTVSPRPDPDARGFVSNLTLSHTLADLYRAFLESLTFSLRENLDFLKSCGFTMNTIRSIGGAASSDVWLRMKADATGMPVERPVVSEAAAFGAAMLAAVGAGEFDSIKECSEKLYKSAETLEPDRARGSLYQGPYQRYLDMRRRAYGH